MLTQVTVRASKLTQTHKTLEQIEKTASGTLDKVDELERIEQGIKQLRSRSLPVGAGVPDGNGDAKTA